MEETNLTLPEEKPGYWQKSKWLIKAGLIAVITLLLQVPAWYVRQLIHEREETQQQATSEVTSRWAGRQRVTGPVLVVPYETRGKADSTVTTKTVYILPDSLDLESSLQPLEKHRGIYQVMLYNSQLRFKGRFPAVTASSIGVPGAVFRWDLAQVSLGISDPRGLQEAVNLQLAGQAVQLDGTNSQSSPLGAGILGAAMGLDGSAVSFNGSYALNGSGNLSFVPVGQRTRVKLNTAWKDPSFTGNELPVHGVSDSSVQATWNSSAFHRPFPQTWLANEQPALDKASFGVDLFIPVNGYQKVTRSVKYAMLCIILTFAAFFIAEDSSRRPIHPFQYLLIGLALVLFYTLLLSISEYTGFDLAYLLASVATIGLIGWFARSLLHSGKLSGMLSLVLVLLYAYVFSLLQLEDYSLLLGSVGLFLSLGVIMRFSRKLSW